MKTNRTVRGLKVAGIGLWLGTAAIMAQTNWPADLELVPPGQVPIFGSFWSMAQPKSPPAPGFVLRDLGVEVPVYALGPPGEFLVDARGVDYSTLPSLEPPLAMLALGAGSPSSLTGTDCDFGCGCSLWLDISAGGTNVSTSGTVLVRLRHIREGQNYTIWSSTSLSPTNWSVETNLVGTTEGYTETLISMGSRSNLFFRASGPAYSGATNYVLATNFPSLGYIDTQIDPPDSMGAVGPNHFVVLLNGSGTNQSAIRVYSKSGAVVAQTNTLDFFQLGTNAPDWDSIVDIRILFDRQFQRWVASGQILTTNEMSDEVVLAISKTDSPVDLAAGWMKHPLWIRRDQLHTDFPTLGLDGNGVYVTALMDRADTNMGHTVMAIKKPEVYAGILITNRLDVYTTNTLPVWTIQPAVNFDNVAPDASAWFVAKGPPDLGANYRGGAIYYRRLQWADTNVAWAETNWIALSDTITNYRNYYDLDGTNVDVVLPATGVFAPELGSAKAFDLQRVGSRLGNAVIRDGFLWTCQTVGLDTTNGTYIADRSGAAVDRSGIQWLKLRLDFDAYGGSLSYITNGRICDKTFSNAWYYCFPSMMVNCAGDVAMGFSGTSAVTNMGAFYSWRRADGTVPPQPTLIRPGTAFYQGSTQWGDYSATTLDPADDLSFWTVQEYADPLGNPGDTLYLWRTVIAKMRPVP